MIPNVLVGASKALIIQKDGRYENKRLSDCYVMQSTGIKDRCGNSIYEGDIINYRGITNDGFIDLDGDPVIRVIYYENSGTRFTMSNLLLTKNESNYFEIIGNVFENENLLPEFELFYFNKYGRNLLKHH
jgi:uncharacterized phage protein (TIGR01671 family)